MKPTDAVLYGFAIAALISFTAWLAINAPWVLLTVLSCSIGWCAVNKLRGGA